MNKVLQIKNINKHFDGIKALDNFSCDVDEKEILGLIGPNGAGKSTLFNVITNFIQSDSGTVIFNSKNISKNKPHNIVGLGISRTFQDLRLIRQLSVIDNVMLSFQNQKGESIHDIFVNNKGIKNEEYINNNKAIELLDLAGILDKKNDLAGNLSYGQQKLLSIVCCLASDSKLLLLDEPIAGVNPAMREKILDIIKNLSSMNKTVILIDHDMDFVMNICDRIIFMDAGKKVSEGRPQELRNDPKLIEAYLE